MLNQDLFARAGIRMQAALS